MTYCHFAKADQPAVSGKGVSGNVKRRAQWSCSPNWTMRCIWEAPVWRYWEPSGRPSWTIVLPLSGCLALPQKTKQKRSSLLWTEYLGDSPEKMSVRGCVQNPTNPAPAAPARADTPCASPRSPRSRGHGTCLAVTSHNRCGAQRRLNPAAPRWRGLTPFPIRPNRLTQLEKQKVSVMTYCHDQPPGSAAPARLTCRMLFAGPYICANRSVPTPHQPRQQ